MTYFLGLLLSRVNFFGCDFGRYIFFWVSVKRSGLSLPVMFILEYTLLGYEHFKMLRRNSKTNQQRSIFSPNCETVYKMIDLASP